LAAGLHRQGRISPPGPLALEVSASNPLDLVTSVLCPFNANCVSRYTQRHMLRQVTPIDLLVDARPCLKGGGVLRGGVDGLVDSEARNPDE
jgi:hypothetical protein